MHKTVIFIATLLVSLSLLGCAASGKKDTGRPGVTEADDTKP